MRLPLLSSREALTFEEQRFAGHPEQAEAAMILAGSCAGKRAAADFPWLDTGEDQSLSLHLLCGKGHNTGDALYAATALIHALSPYRIRRVALLLTQDASLWSAEVSRAHESLRQSGAPVETFSPAQIDGDLLNKLTSEPGLHLLIDGLFGMQFRPPLRAPERKVIQLLNAHHRFDLRIAIDLPSGLDPDEPSAALRADVTYATAIAKSELFTAPIETTGRIRLIDIGFFQNEFAGETGIWSIGPKRVLRPAACDKRDFGHLLLIGGSRTMPGALIMAARAAIQSGVGLLTVGAPASHCSHLGGLIPEAMWLPWPENEAGGLTPHGLELLKPKNKQFSTLALGPGMGRHADTCELLRDLVLQSTCPLLLDADALHPDVIDAVARSAQQRPYTVLTPHAGEWARIHEGSNPADFARRLNAQIIAKGPRTSVIDATRQTWIPHGGPVLARGGSGDILAGWLAGRMASEYRNPAHNPHALLCQATAEHGRAADLMSACDGDHYTRTTALLQHL